MMIYCFFYRVFQSRSGILSHLNNLRFKDNLDLVDVSNEPVERGLLALWCTCFGNKLTYGFLQKLQKKLILQNQLLRLFHCYGIGAGGDSAIIHQESH